MKMVPFFRRIQIHIICIYIYICVCICMYIVFTFQTPWHYFPICYNPISIPWKDQSFICPQGQNRQVASFCQGHVVIDLNWPVLGLVTDWWFLCPIPFPRSSSVVRENCHQFSVFFAGQVGESLWLQICWETEKSREVSNQEFSLII